MPVPSFLSMEELRDRYGLGKTALADRLKHCSISGKRTGNKSFVNSGQIEVLDALDRHLKQGRGLADFSSPYVEIVEETTKPTPTETPSTAIVPQFYEPSPETIEVDSGDIIYRLERMLSFLDKAVNNGWMLPTSAVREIIGATPRPPKWGRYGFVFKPAGSHGQETAWIITKR